MKTRTIQTAKEYNFAYKELIKYIFFSFLFFALFFALDKTFPLALALFAALLLLKFSKPLTVFLFILPSLVFFDLNNLIAASSAAVMLLFAVIVYEKLNAKVKAELALYAALALLPYIFIGSPSKDELIYRAIVSAFSVILTFITLNAAKITLTGKIKFKPVIDQIICLCIVLILCGAGILKMRGDLVLKGLASFCVLSLNFMFGLPVGCVASIVFAMPFAVIYFNIAYAGVFFIWACVSACFKDTPKILSACGLVLSDVILSYYFNAYFTYSYLDIAAVTAGGIAFLLFPNAVSQKIKDNFLVFKEKKLSKFTINRSRNLVSCRLHEISGVFKEMEDVFGINTNNVLDDESACGYLTDEVYEKICGGCRNLADCGKNGRVSRDEIYKIIKYGMAQGKITVLNLPKELTSKCSNVNNFMTGVNKTLGDYRNYILANSNLQNGKKLIGGQAGGIARILKDLALETGKALCYDNKTEDLIISELLARGMAVNEIMVFGEGDDITVNLLLLSGEKNLNNVEKIVSEVLGFKTAVTEKTSTGANTVCYVLKKAPKYDAAFGASGKNKDGSNESGDTHSLIRIDGSKFMIALSDGMGSGAKARQVSSAAISLLENFYKAGLSSETILSTINKLLTINLEESFAAIDICVVDLSRGAADFIKIGAPYGFIKSGDNIKIIENGCLPLGILDELKPTIRSAELSAGDLIILTTDGVISSFPSSVDAAEFIRFLSPLNPQSLTDDLIKKSLALSGGKASDDMTALAVRIFER